MSERQRWLAGFLSVLIVGTSYAQVPPPPPASPTLWSFLGIPQGLYKLNAQLVNRRGNHPKLEKKPPLKAIADAANLKSDVPAIKAAAEIKQAEDLKPQKIKAIKYLASIGCGCYDKDEKITKALLAATEDCTEDVRLEAVRAVEMAAQGEQCEQCKQKNCCNEKLVAQLAKMAYDRDDKGCYVEPSERVREAAIAALKACCPGGPPVTEAEPEPAPVEGVEQAAPPVEGAGPPPGNATDPPPAPPPSPPQPEPTTMSPPIVPSRDKTAINYRRPRAGSSRQISAELTRARIQTIAAREARPDMYVPHEIVRDEHEQPSQVPGRNGPAPVYRKVVGHIVHIGPQGALYHLHLENDAVLPAGTAVKVLQPTSSGSVTAAVLHVTESESGWANARPASSSRRVPVVRGAPIEAWR